ncbi:MAG: hypothetical protein IPN38_18040 [Flavobacteriales bacterium]|nr:hypothetical protein [Flavobacteriales bacterium]
MRVLWAGNAQGDAELKYIGASNDRDPILTVVGGTTPNNTTTGYSAEDVNLDGVVKYIGADNDRDPILTNVGSTTPEQHTDAAVAVSFRWSLLRPLGSARPS